MSSAEARREAHGLAAATIRAAIDSGEIDDLIADDYNDADARRVVAWLGVLADRHSVRGASE